MPKKKEVILKSKIKRLKKQLKILDLEQVAIKSQLDVLMAKLENL